MSNVYQAHFQYPTGPGHLEKIRDLTLEWAEAPIDFERAAGRSRHEWPRETVNVGIEIIDQSSADTPAWGCRLQHQSSQDDEQYFVVDVTASADGSELRLGIRIELEDRAPVIRPARLTPDPPRLVRSIGQAFDDQKSHLLHVLSRDGVGDFVQHLESPDRAVPVLVISLRNWEGTSFFTDPGQIASRLSGVAETWIYVDKLVERELRDRISERHTAGDGAVRIYWPRWRPSDDPFSYPLFTPAFIQRRRNFVRGLERWMANEVITTTSRSSRPGWPTWSMLVSANHRGEIDEARSSGTDAELVSLLDADNQLLVRENRLLDHKVTAAEQEIYRLQSRLAAVEVRRADPIDKTTVDPAFEAQSVEEMIAHIEERYSDRVVVELNNASDSDAEFKDIDRFQKAIIWLCTDFVAWKRGERAGVNYKDLQLELKNLCSFDYKTGQSRTTIGRNRADYETTYDERRFEITEHIGWGKKASNKPIRVAFAWDDVTDRLVIGYVGPHQKTDASN